MDNEDWRRFEELVHQAGGVANAAGPVPDSIRADAMAFHTLGLAIRSLHQAVDDIQNQLAGDNIRPNKSVLILP